MSDQLVMDIAHAGLKQQPFHMHGEPATVVHYQSEQSAHNYLRMIAAGNRGIGVLFGPEFSGKKTVIRHFVASLPADLAVAIADGTKMNATGLLEAIRSQFAFEVESDLADASLNELQEFILQQTRESRIPLLVVENFNKMYPSALRILCILAEIKLQGRFALRIVLVSSKPSFNIIHAPAMTTIAARTISSFEMGPLTPTETLTYLYDKLRAGGCDTPETVLPAEICDELHKTSRGLPGALDKLVAQAIDRAEHWPIRREHIYPPAAASAPASPPVMAPVRDAIEPDVQKLYLTLNRETLQEFDLEDSKTLIGRSEICDVCINSRFVSKHHALLIRKDDAMLLLDLNSTNGTFVNSRRVQSAVLRHDDVISLGNHGIKLVAPAYRTRPAIEKPDLGETATMRTLADLRPSTADAPQQAVAANKPDA